nr:type I restriction enzyme endonuclease domain-containing protein [Fructobacillus tropaeoli]
MRLTIYLRNDSAQRTSWVQRELARGSMRNVVKRLLRKYGYPLDFAKFAVETVVE